MGIDMQIEFGIWGGGGGGAEALASSY